MINLTKDEFKTHYLTLKSAELAKRLGVSFNTIQYHARKLGLHKKRGRPSEHELFTTEELRELYNTYTSAAICKKYNLNGNTFYSMLKKHGIELRGRLTIGKKLNIHE